LGFLAPAATPRAEKTSTVAASDVLCNGKLVFDAGGQRVLPSHPDQGHCYCFHIFYYFMKIFPGFSTHRFP
jgi:hypothetical protein